MKWVVVNIGCIECRVSSGLVGVFADRSRADQVAATLSDKMYWREGGQNRYEVFELPEPEVVAAEYAEALDTGNGTNQQPGLTSGNE